MTIGAIIQARMSSRRLPGKVLLPLAGKPLLQHVINALQKIPSLAGIVVATSSEESDNSVADYCGQNSIAYFRGSLTNVAQRFLQALEQQGWDAALRVSADSPMLNWRLVEEAVAMFASGKWDIVTNVFPRSYPHGQSVEIISRAALQQAYPKFSTPEESEHVTPYFYAHAANWRIDSIISPQDRSREQLSIDTPEDFERIQALMTEHAKT